MNHENKGFLNLMKSVDSLLNSITDDLSAKLDFENHQSKLYGVVLDTRNNHCGLKRSLMSKAEPFKKEDLSEEKLSEYMSGNRAVIAFTQNIAFKIIQKALEVGMSIEAIADLLEIKYMPPDIEGFPNHSLMKPGYTKVNAMNIVRSIQRQLLIPDETRKLMGDGINQIMGALWNVTYSMEFALLCVQNNNVLANKLIWFFKAVFNADFSLKQIVDIISKDKYNIDILFDCFASANQTHYSSVQRKQLGNSKYVRRRVDNFKPEFVKRASAGNGHDSLFYDSTGSDAIMKGSSKYDIVPDSNYAQVMNMYNRKYLAGPSGSTVASFITCFELVGMTKSSSNIALFLGCSIANYIPAYHTLTEVLMSFTDEVDLYMLPKRFDLKNDPVLYAIEVMQYNGFVFPVDILSLL
jgi:hypothetical protein